MAVSLVHARCPSSISARYDRMMLELELDANPPAGAILHIATEAVGGDQRLRGVADRRGGRELRRAQAARRAQAVGRDGAALLPDRAVAQPVRSGHGHDRSASARRSVASPALEPPARHGSRRRQSASAREAAARTLHGRVRRALRPAPGDPGRSRPRQAARRGRRQQGDARDPPRAARGGRQLPGREGLRRGREGARRSARTSSRGSTPGQQVVKLVHDQLTELMGSATRSSPSAGRRP